MLRQIECEIQNGPSTKDGVLPVINLFFRKFYFSLRTNLWRVDLMYESLKFILFILFECVRVLFEGAFSQWVSSTGA